MIVEESGPATGTTAAKTFRARAVRGGGILIACKWSTQLLSWGVTLGVARALSPEDYGVVAAASLLLGLSDLFAEAGVGRALVQKQGVTEADLARAFTLSTVLSVGCYLALLAGAPAASTFLRTPELRAVLPVMGALILLVPLRTVPLGILDRRLELKTQGVVHVVTTVLQAAVVLALALAGAGYWALVAGVMTARLVECATLVALAGWRPRLVADLRGSGELLRYGLWLSGGSLLWYFYSNSDFAIVGRFGGPVVLGYYSLAFQLMSLPMQRLTANVNQVAFPVFCRLRGEPEKVKNWYIRLTVLMVAVVLPTLLGGALVAGDGITTLLGAKWRPAVAPFQVLCVVGLLGVIGTSLISLLNALGRPDVNFKYTAVCACVYPPAFAVAARYHGVMGVCVAWAVVYVAAVTLLIVCTRRITSIGVRDLASAQWPAVLAGAAMAAAVVAVHALIGARLPVPARLAADVCVGAATYPACLWALARETVIADMKSLWRDVRAKGTD